MIMRECKLCGRLVTTEGPRICPRCRQRLEDVYSEVHNHMRDNQDETFDMERISEELDINPADVQALIELGYIERDIQTYGKKTHRERRNLVGALTNELEKMKSSKKVTTYGGEKYARGLDGRQYVYDGQHRR